MRRSLVAPLSGAAQCDIVIAIYRISLSFAGNELGNDPTVRKQLRWRRRLDLICTSGQRRTNTLVARTYARWPLRASGVLDPLARTGPPSKKSRRASGPAVNVEACYNVARARFLHLKYNIQGSNPDRRHVQSKHANHYTTAPLLPVVYYLCTNFFKNRVDNKWKIIWATYKSLTSSLANAHYLSLSV